jgi:hypothetical protein
VVVFFEDKGECGKEEVEDSVNHLRDMSVLEHLDM